MFILNVVAAILIKPWILNLLGLILNFSAATFQIFKLNWNRFGNRVYSATCWSFRNTAVLRSSLQEQRASQPGVCENAMLLERGIHLAWVVVDITLDLASESLRQRRQWLWWCRSPSLTSVALPFPWMALPNTLISSSWRYVLWDLPYILQMGKCF